MILTIGELQPWADPATVAIACLPMRVPSAADAPGGRHRLDLNGAWRLRLFGSPDSATIDPDDARSTVVQVPGNWTMQGIGDLPHYTNVQMPFPGPPPRLRSTTRPASTTA